MQNDCYVKQGVIFPARLDEMRFLYLCREYKLRCSISKNTN